MQSQNNVYFWHNRKILRNKFGIIKNTKEKGIILYLYPIKQIFTNLILVLGFLHKYILVV